MESISVFSDDNKNNTFNNGDNNGHRLKKVSRVYYVVKLKNVGY